MNNFHFYLILNLNKEFFLNNGNFYKKIIVFKKLKEFYNKIFKSFDKSVKSVNNNRLTNGRLRGLRQ